MRKYIFFLLILAVLIPAGTFCLLKKKVETPVGVAEPVKPKPKTSEYIGEKIVYDVKLGLLNVGRAEFNHLKGVELDGADLNLMTFQTRLARFNDLENIYSDPETSLPIKVVRRVTGWNKNEQITEDYDQKNHRLSITKVVGDKSELMHIQKSDVIHNAILLPFYLRRYSDIEPGWSLSVQLPTADFVIRLSGLEKIKVPAGEFEVYRFDSQPDKFEIWVTADKRRIPVRIKGTGAFGYILLMREYSLINPGRTNPVEVAK